jgi:hypothetical protein
MDVSMDAGRVFLVVCLTLIIVIGFNAALFVALRRGNEASQIELFKRAASRAREPWAQEDEALRELSKRVAELKRGTPDEASPVGGEPPEQDRK